MRRTGFKRRAATPSQRPGPRRKATPRARRISEASEEQRAKVRGARSITGAEGKCDPAHLWDRSLGGCSSALCVVPLTRAEHRAYESGDLDLLPYLVGSHVDELQHALGHANGSLSRLLHKITGKRWRPE